jgi:Domain of unknown function (DUF4116)
VTVREGREFILRLVNRVDRVLQYAPSIMKYDKEILLAAVARSSATISDCFDSFELDADFDFLCQFTSDVRSSIATHNAFMELLRGILVDPDCPLCPLSMLKLDAETGIALKKLIAGFADIRFPLMASVQSLNAALANLEKFGF